MNIKAGQAVRVDSTLSAREPHGPQEEAQINTFYARSRDGDGVERGWRKDEPFGWIRGWHGKVEQARSSIPSIVAFPCSFYLDLSLFSSLFLTLSLSLSLSFLLRATVIRNIIKLSASSFATIFSFSCAPSFLPRLSRPSDKLLVTSPRASEEESRTRS